MLSVGIIDPLCTECCIPVVLVQKKDDPKLRFGVSFSKLNDVSTFDPYPMPRVNDLVDRLGRFDNIQNDAPWFAWSTSNISEAGTWDPERSRGLCSSLHWWNYFLPDLGGACATSSRCLLTYSECWSGHQTWGPVPWLFDWRRRHTSTGRVDLDDCGSTTTYY